MRRKRTLFEELFPSWVDRGLGILGLGIVPVVGAFVNVGESARTGLTLFLLATILWVAIRCLKSVVDIVNSNAPTEIRVRTNRVSVTLLPTEEEEDTDPALQSDHSVCICVWNGGKETKCTVTLRFPSFLQLSIAEEQALGVEKRSDFYSRTFVLPRGEAHFVTINKITLPSSMVELYRESSRQLRIEVTHDSPESVQEVNSVAVVM